MTGKNISGSAILTATVTVMYIIFLSSAALAAPVTPHSFLGTAQLNGNDAPAGSVITAEVSNVAKGRVTLAYDGSFGLKYLDGSGERDDLLSVRNAQNGDEISFFVQAPHMSNRIKADQTHVFKSGDKTEISLTFEGEEITKPSNPPNDDGGSGGGSGSSGGSGGSGQPLGNDEPQGTETEQESENPPTAEGKTHDATLGTEPVTLEVSNKDTINLNLAAGTFPITVKSMSGFSVLLDYQGTDIVLGKGDSKTMDLDSDGKEDAEVTLDKVVGASAFLTFSQLQKPENQAQTTGSDFLTGLATAEMSMIILVTVIIIAALGGVVYKFSRRN